MSLWKSNFVINGVTINEFVPTYGHHPSATIWPGKQPGFC